MYKFWLSWDRKRFRMITKWLKLELSFVAGLLYWKLAIQTILMNVLLKSKIFYLLSNILDQERNVAAVQITWKNQIISEFNDQCTWITLTFLKKYFDEMLELTKFLREGHFISISDFQSQIKTLKKIYNDFPCEVVYHFTKRDIFN